MLLQKTESGQTGKQIHRRENFGFGKASLSDTKSAKSKKYIQKTILLLREVTKFAEIIGERQNCSSIHICDRDSF